MGAWPVGAWPVELFKIKINFKLFYVFFFLLEIPLSIFNENFKAELKT